MSQVLPQDCAAGRAKFKILWGFSSPPLPTFIFLPVSYLFVAECISLTSLAVCVLLTWIALLLLNVCWLGVEKGIVSCCQSTRLQLQRILITHPPKISRWLLTSPARYIWRCLFFFPFWGACGTIKLNMRDGFWSLNLNLNGKAAINASSRALQPCVITVIYKAEDNDTDTLVKHSIPFHFICFCCRAHIVLFLFSTLFTCQHSHWTVSSDRHDTFKVYIVFPTRRNKPSYGWETAVTAERRPTLTTWKVIPADEDLYCSSSFRNQRKARCEEAAWGPSWAPSSSRR